MQKNFTHLSSTPLTNSVNSKTNNNTLPSKKTIQNILNFAASYRVEKCNDAHYVEYLLN